MNISERTENIRGKILSEATVEAENIIEEAKKKALEILNSATQTAKEKVKQETLLRENHIKEMSRQHIAETKVENYRRIQTFKDEQITRVFEEAKEQLKKKVETEDYSEILIKLIVEAVAVLDETEVKITLNKRDKNNITQKHLEQVSEKLAKKQKKVQLQVTNTVADILGGVIVSSVDGKKMVDNSLDARLDRIKEEAKLDLEKILFE